MMKKLIPLKTLLIFSLVLLSFGGSAQQIGKIIGVTIDNDNETIPFVRVRLKNTPYQTQSDSNGVFRLTDIPTGEYNIQFDAFIQQPYTTKITVQQGRTIDLKQVQMTAPYMLDIVTLSASRTERKIDDTPTQVTVVTGEQIENMGAIRLSEVLAEQTGLNLVEDHGTGIQVQGFDSEYTLIMVNGQPLIGRTSGTLELDRISVNNIKKIEITKGPSSSLWGNEALAGVINIITEEPQKGLKSTLGIKYRTYNTLDISADVDTKKNNLGMYFYVNRYSSNGYDITPETVGQTVGRFSTYTATGNINYKFNDKSDIALDLRFFNEDQTNSSETTEGDNTRLLNFKGRQYDWNANITYKKKLSEKSKLITSNYTTGYNTKSTHLYSSDGSEFSNGYFTQFYNKSEVLVESKLNKKHILTAGGGIIIENVTSDRYNNIDPFRTLYAFGQEEWNPFKNKKIVVVAGARFDSHSEYAHQLSPKLSAHYKATKWLKIKGSYGYGFKAPDFRQLYLNFTNATVGYSVIGSNILKDELPKFMDRGEISTLLLDYTQLSEIKAERSKSINIGFDLKPTKKVTFNFNFFRNDVNDLIDAIPIAVKTNGQQLFSYINRENIYTQGVENNLSIKPIKDLTISFGYQYLEAWDKTVEQKIREGKVFAKNRDGITKKVKISEYGGLLNRSKHTANFKIFYTYKPAKLDVSLRAIYRGKYGIRDINNNLILDDEAEYAKGYTTWNFTIAKGNDDMKIQFGIDNIFEAKNKYTTNTPSRFIYLGANIILIKNQK